MDHTITNLIIFVLAIYVGYHVVCRNRKPQGLEVPRGKSQGWRWQLSTRPPREGMQEASAKGKPARLKRERR